MKKPNRIIQLSVALALAGGTAGVWAAGFALMEQNASGLGNAYAGQAAAAEDASTIFFNPAGMTRLQGGQAAGVLNMIRPSAKLTVDTTRSGLPTAAVLARWALRAAMPAPLGTTCRRAMCRTR